MSIFEINQQLGQLREPDREFHWVGNDPEVVERRQEPQLGLLSAGLALTVVALLVRLSFLQVTEATAHQLLAQGNRIRNRDLASPRGLIVDRHGTVLAKNVAEFAVELVPADLPRERGQRETVYERISSTLDLSSDELRQRTEAQGLFSLDPMLLLEHLDHDQALRLKILFNDVPGVRVVDRPRREYVRAPGIGHLLGYTGKVSQAELDQSDRYTLTSIVGKTGLEQRYEELLAGVRGVEQVEVDSKGHLQRIIGESVAIPGDTLTVSLDLALQQKLGEVLRSKLEAVQSMAGVAVVMKPVTGEILAMVSLPDYDNNEFAGGISTQRYAALSGDELAPLNNRAVSGVYPSGSVIKPLVAAGGLAEGVITEQTSINAPGEITVGDFVFPDWKTHGIVDVKKAIAVSSNVFFYAVGGGWESIRGLGVAKLNEYLQRFGLGRPTGIDLPNEAAGLVPDPVWKERVKHEAWYLGDTYHLAIGQGDLLATPIQILTGTAAIANGGTLVTPHLFLRNQPNENREPMQAPEARAKELVSATVLRVVREGMRQGVEIGSSRRLQSLSVSAGAKTGTAQFGVPTTPGGDPPTHAWFTAFAPYENPEVAMVVLVEGGGAGNEVALPVAEEVLAWHFQRPEQERQ